MIFKEETSQANTESTALVKLDTNCLNDDNKENQSKNAKSTKNALIYNNLRDVILNTLNKKLQKNSRKKRPSKSDLDGVFYNFKLKLAGEVHSTDNEGQYVRTPHFISYDEGLIDQFKVLCTRPITTTEILQIIRRDVKHSSRDIREYSEKGNVFDFATHHLSLKKGQYTISRLKQKFNLEFSKADTNCGLCFGRREEELAAATEECCRDNLHIVKEREEWVKKTQVAKFLSKNYKEEKRLNMSAQRQDTTENHDIFNGYKVTLEQFLIPTKDEIVNKNSSDDVLLIIHPTDTTLERVYDQLIINRTVVTHTGHMDRKDFSNNTKLYVGDVKYVKWRETKKEELAKKFWTATDNHISLLRNKINRVQETGVSRFRALKEYIEKLNSEKYWYKARKRFSPFTSLFTYSAFDYDECYFAFSTRVLKAELIDEMLKDCPKPATISDVDVYQWTCKGRSTSISFIVDPKYHVDTVMGALYRYTKFLEKNQCTSCSHPVNNDEPSDEEKVEMKHFLEDSKIVLDGVLPLSYSLDFNTAYPDFTSFLKSNVSKDNKFEISPQEPQSIHILDIPAVGNKMKDILLVLTPAKKLDVKKFLSVLKNDVYSDEDFDTINEDWFIHKRASLHIGAGELFEQEFHTLCQ